jgi:hypothetical protein
MEEKDNTWKRRLTALGERQSAIFDAQFIQRFGDRQWTPSDADKLAAHSFHVELISRIATQPLGYASGVERRALTSIFELFGHARKITQENTESQTFETIVWHVLNTYVRPFTARWHAKSESGELNALDSSDLFRAELEIVQKHLVALDDVLTAVRAVDGLSVSPVARPVNQSLKNEMDKIVGWRPMGIVRNQEQSPLSSTEEEKVLQRRSFYQVANRDWAAGLALSGGGIRSATFAMGVMVALSKRGLLPQFDYMSTVSGGGYTGSFLTQLLSSSMGKNRVSLREKDLPFKRTDGESEILQRVRQGASYLSGSVWERFTLAMAQAQGIFLNVFFLFCFICVFAFIDYIVRWHIPDAISSALALWSSLLIVGLFLLMPLVRGWSKKSLAGKDRWMALVGALLLVPPLWAGLGILHQITALLVNVTHADQVANVAQLVKIWTVVGSLVVAAGAIFATISLARPIVLTTICVCGLILAETAAYHMFVAVGGGTASTFVAGMMLVAGMLWLVLDINATSLHGYYRTKLTQSFFIDANCQPVQSIRLSEVDGSRTIFPILNCALNVPGSTDPRMRGRQADLLCFTPVSAGASLIGHTSIEEWERANPLLDLGTAMALSGAAVSPQMGLRTKRYSSFWLTLLNLRLGAWLKNPRALGAKKAFPTVRNLFQELLATADENDAFLQISDGGHIENLGIYELLRRRCRFIVAVDGEQDEKMTFHALTNLQRLAYIDHGIIIEANLEDLRIGNQGFSRSHFRFCRIRYPLGELDQEEEIGYLVYLKLSLTGNEGEFIRRYKLDEPAFPHQSTANQFFTEVQFEAYRALGEHVGDKMFLRAIVGLPDIGQIDIEQWFQGLGNSFLDPLI